MSVDFHENVFKKKTLLNTNNKFWMENKDNEIDEAEKDLEKFDEMEKNFHRVVQDLISDQSFDHFREEYEKLHDELLASHKNNQALIDKCKELNNSILANANKVSSVLNLSQNDQRTIAGLRHEFDRAWKMVEISQEKEMKSKETIETLKVEISNLSRLVEQGGSAAFMQEASLQDISDQISSLKKEIPVQVAEISNLNSQLSEAQQNTNELRKQIQTHQEEQNSLIQEIEQLRSSNQDVVTGVETAMTQILSLKDEIKSLQNQQSEVDEKVLNQKSAIKDQKEELESHRQDIRSANEDLQSAFLQVRLVQKQFEGKQKKTDKTVEFVTQRQNNINQHDESHQYYINKLTEATEENAQLQDELNELKTYSKEIDEERKQFRNKVSECNNKIILLLAQTSKQQSDNQTKRLNIEKIIKNTRDTHAKEVQEKAATLVVEEQSKLITSNIMSIKSQQHDFRGKVVKINQETRQYEDNAIRARSNRSQINEEIKIREKAIDDNTMHISSLQEQIKHQLSLTETVQNERDIACRLLTEADKENQVTKEKNEILAQQIKSLKEDIREKDKLCVETHYKQKTIRRQVITLHKELNQIKRDLKAIDEQTTEIRNKTMRSQFLLTSSDLETMKQQQSLNEIKASADIMEKMTVRHVSEKEQLIAKAHLLKYQIEHAKAAYTKQTEEIEKLKNELISEVELNEHLQSQNRHGKALKLELIRVQKSLLQAQGKSRALEEEIEKPMNVHRWRILDATNPEQSQLIRMNMALRDKLMILISKLEQLMRSKKALQDRNAIEERHLQNSYGGQYDSEYAYYNEILKEKIRMLQKMQEQAAKQGNYVQTTRDQLMTVRTMIREEKTELYGTKKQIRAKSSYGTTRNNSAIKKTPPRTDVKFIGGGFAVGGIQSPQNMKPQIRPQTRQGAGHAPTLILPHNTTPRKPKSNLQMTKQTPKGWNPKRQPISPFLPTANGTEDF